jgi:hypothetical protein
MITINYLQNKWVRSREHQSDLAGRIMSGNCGPLSWSEVKKGRATINDFLVIWAGGTASSKSNDRTKANKIAFILIIFPKNSASVNNAPKRIDSDEKAHSATANR